MSTNCMPRQIPGRWLGDRFSEYPPGLKVCPDGRMGLGQSFLVAHPPGCAILKVGHAGDEAAVFLAPEYLYCVPIFRFSHRATSFPATSCGLLFPQSISGNLGEGKAKAPKTEVSPEDTHASSSSLLCAPVSLIFQRLPSRPNTAKGAVFLTLAGSKLKI